MARTQATRPPVIGGSHLVRGGGKFANRFCHIQCKCMYAYPSQLQLEILFFFMMYDIIHKSLLKYTHIYVFLRYYEVFM